MSAGPPPIPDTVLTAPEPSRARYPDRTGYARRGGVNLFYEVYGEGDPTVLLLPTWSIVHSRAWKAQIPYLARHFRVITFDGRGNGKSDRPRGVKPYTPDEFVADAVAVLDVTQTDQAVVAGWSLGGAFGIQLAAQHPDRVLGLACIAPLAASAIPHTRAIPLALFNLRLPRHPGWARFNRHFIREHQKEFVEWFARVNCSEPHSTRQIEDHVSWALETDADTLARTAMGFVGLRTLLRLQRFTREAGCPMLVIHGERDRNQPYRDGAALARRKGARFVSIAGDHSIAFRKPVKVNLALREFAESLVPDSIAGAVPAGVRGG